MRVFSSAQKNSFNGDPYETSGTTKFCIRTNFFYHKNTETFTNANCCFFFIFGTKIIEYLRFDFQILWFRRYSSNHMVFVMPQLVLSFESKIRNGVCSYINTVRWRKVTHNQKSPWCRHNHDENCRLPNSESHLLLIAEKDFKEIVEKLATFCFTCQSVEYLCVTIRCIISSNTITKIEEILVFLFIKGVDGNLSITVKRLLQNKVMNNLLRFFQRSVSTQTIWSLFAAKFDQLG